MPLKTPLMSFISFRLTFRLGLVGVWFLPPFPYLTLCISFDLDRTLCASGGKFFEDTGSVAEGLHVSWNAIDGGLISGCKLGYSLPISGRIVYSLGKSIHEKELLLAGIAVT